MKAPIVVYDHGDVSIFESAEDAENYLEPIDVEREEYVAYDSEGYLLRLAVNVKSRRIWGILPIREKGVVLQEIAPRQERLAELRQILKDYLSYPRFKVPSDWIAEATLEELIGKAKKLQRTIVMKSIFKA